MYIHEYVCRARLAGGRAPVVAAGGGAGRGVLDYIISYYAILYYGILYNLYYTVVYYMILCYVMVYYIVVYDSIYCHAIL